MIEQLVFVPVLGFALLVGWLQLRGAGLLPAGRVGTLRRAWREAARAAGLARVEESPRDLSGWAGRVHVSLSRYDDGTVYGTRFILRGPGVVNGLTVRAEALGTALRAVVGEREIEIGDEALDRAAWIQGPPALAHALLDRDTRGAVGSVLGGYLLRPGKMPLLAAASLEGGVLRVDVPAVLREGGGFDVLLAALFDVVAGDERPEAACLGRPERMPEVLGAVLELARRFEPPEDVAARIAGNLRHEPEARVRLRSLTALVREHPKHPATREALLRAREDPDAEVRLRAAVELGEEGRAVLLALAAGEGAEDATTARAVTALGARLDPHQARGLLSQALRTRRGATARACMEALGRHRSPESVSALSRVLAVERGDLAVAAAEALGLTHDPEAEPPLLRALASGSSDLRRAAAGALGRTGTASAVSALKAAESRHTDLAATARQAIAEIKTRLSGAEPGQLSLAVAEGEQGRLSLADADPAGRLTLAEPGSGGDGRAPD